MTFPTGAQGAWTEDEIESLFRGLIGVLRRIKNGDENGYPPIPRDPVWEAAKRDGLVW